MEYTSTRITKTQYNKLEETFPEFHFIKHRYYGLNGIVMSEESQQPVVYMCEECYELIYGQRKRSIDSTVIPTSTSKFVKLEPVYRETMFARECPFCNIHDVKLIELDYNIAYPIHILNTKGFRTSFSCEGHLENSDCFPYILFEGLEILDYVDNLGDSWFLDLEGLRDYPNRVVIRSNWVEQYNDKLEYMIELMEWVKSLPCIK